METDNRITAIMEFNRMLYASKTMKGTIHHIEIYVSDLEKTIEFWNWLLTELGYEKYQEWNEGISYWIHIWYLSRPKKNFLIYHTTEREPG